MIIVSAYMRQASPSGLNDPLKPHPAGPLDKDDIILARSDGVKQNPFCIKAGSAGKQVARVKAAFARSGCRQARQDTDCNKYIADPGSFLTGQGMIELFSIAQLKHIAHNKYFSSPCLETAQCLQRLAQGQRV
jgi:hypothetical protein